MIILLAVLAVLPLVGTLEFRLADEATEGWGVLHWPVLAGEPEVVERINETLSYETLIGETIAETAEYYRQYERCIVSSGFEVNYMDEDYLDISIFWGFVGAYPSDHEISMLFSLEDGTRVSPKDLFHMENLPSSARVRVTFDPEGITDYLGHGEFRTALSHKGHVFSMMLRNQLESGFDRGAVELGWSIPLFNYPYLKAYVQYFYGYI